MRDRSAPVSLSDNRPLRIALVGFGNVGQGLVELLREKADLLRERENFRPQVVAVATRTRGTLLCEDGLNLDHLLTVGRTGHLHDYPDERGVVRGWHVDRILHESTADVMVEMGPTNLRTAMPALHYCRIAFDTGKHVVLANKGPIALAYDELARLAKKSRRRLLFEATVMGGTPSMRVGMQALSGCVIHEARGIVNGTTNYILTQMEGGLPYADALAQAQALGYAEADPTADVDGWDAAGKAIILSAALFRRRLTLDEIDVTGIRHLTPDDIAAAAAAGERWKLIAHITPDGASIRPQRIPVTHPLAGVSGATNAITYSTDILGDVTLVGVGAGRRETGFAILADLLDIHRGMRGGIV